MGNYWVQVRKGEQVQWLAVMADYAQDARDIVLGNTPAEVEVGIAALVEETQPCKACPQQVRCMGGSWNEWRLGQPGVDQGLVNLNSVHTCKTCLDKVLNEFGILKEKLVVPDDCPRWGPVAGSAWDCGGCAAERESLRALNPNSERRVQACGDAFRAVFSVPQKDELGRRRVIKDSSAQIAAALSPGFEDFSTETKVRAQWLIGALLSDVTRRFATPWMKLADEQRAITLSNWLEGICSSLEHHADDHAQVTQHFILLFTDTHQINRLGTGGWADLSLSERRMVMRVWGGIVRETLRATKTVTAEMAQEVGLDPDPTQAG